MITRRTKVQLIVFALITMVGVAFVGARYAQLDRLFIADSYSVVAHFEESGGIFEGAQVSFRGVTVGKVSDMVLTDKGVDVVLDIQKDSAPIPARTRALVGNGSAVGEQYVELQPQSDSGPFLENHSEIPMAMTATPISTSKLLLDLDNTVNSVNKESLRTVVSEFGKAFKGTAPDLGRIIDTSNSFIQAANANFDITTALIDDSNTVLQTQLDKTSAIKSFARDLSRVSDTLVTSDRDLRRVIDSGSATATQLRTFLEQNKVDLASLINNLVTTGEVAVRHLPGTEMLLLLYPYVVAGGFAVIDNDPGSPLMNAHFGMILTQDPKVCHAGYDPGEQRPPENRGNIPMDTDAHCAEPASQSNARGAQNAPRAGAAYRAPVIARYDRSTGTISYTDEPDAVTYTGGAAATFGADSWKWLLLQPLNGSGAR